MMLPPNMTERQRVLRKLLQLVPRDAPAPRDPKVRMELQGLTADLVRTYGDALDDDPFGGVYDRNVPVHDSVRELVAARTVLVTGGEGFVGDALTSRLSDLSVARIASVDSARGSDGRQTRTLRGRVPVVRYRADVRDGRALRRVFERERPEIVFHLAAQRLPGLAETLVRETLSTNLMGTRNVIGLCGKLGVERCVLASTGKASQYISADVYAGSKKLAEWWISVGAARNPSVALAAARFTHIVENSPVASEIDERIRDGVLSLHEPDRFMQVQSVREAVGLLLNALALSLPGSVRIVAVEDPGWPVDVLRVALHALKRSGRDVPLYFRGLQPGYVRHPFPGQFVWHDGAPLNPMVNAIEARDAHVHDGMIVTSPTAVSRRLVEQAMADVDAAVGGPLSEREVAEVFQATVQTVAGDSLRRADTGTLTEILTWGCHPQRVPDDRMLFEHRRLIGLLLDALDGRAAAGGSGFECALARARAVTGRVGPGRA